ncbi:MAG: hypothetical protein SF029_07195 [bacterium]|nr:hypothetical protein [bacterium]
MSPKTPLVLEVTPEQREQVERLSQQQGFANPSEYVLALIASAAKAAVEKAELLDDLRESLREAIAGETIPASHMMAALASEDHQQRTLN